MNVEKLKGIVIGVVMTSIFFLMGVSVYAVVGTFQVNASYSNIKIYVDGKAIDPKDVNGVRVEPFIISGTTYLPVRAISEALGKNVEWDGDTKTVYVGAFPSHLNPAKEQPTAASTLSNWLTLKGSDLCALLEEAFGDNTKVYAQADGSKLIMEIIMSSKGLTDEERNIKAEEFLEISLELGNDYSDMLELIRTDTGFRSITMDVWHYFDEALIFTQELS